MIDANAAGIKVKWPISQQTYRLVPLGPRIEFPDLESFLAAFDGREQPTPPRKKYEFVPYGVSMPLTREAAEELARIFPEAPWAMDFARKLAPGERYTFRRLTALERLSRGLS